jgi:hypothetical protein
MRPSPSHTAQRRRKTNHYVHPVLSLSLARATYTRIDRADIGVVEGRSSLSLSLEAGQRLWVFGYVIRQKLQRDKIGAGLRPRFVDDAHPATAQLLDDAVVRDGVANHPQECYGVWRGKSISSALPQLGVLRLGFLQDGDVGIGVFPESGHCGKPIRLSRSM